jgi:two-component system, cell cycle sensor histidine kinase and response regulator CckA
MAIPLKVLILEDYPPDLELLLYELNQAGFEPDWRQAQSEAGFLASLKLSPDIILADYNMPQFNAPRALELLQQQGMDIPFVIVSGTIGEEVAATCIKQGATDYLLKDRLGRLGPAVKQALEQQQLRRQRKHTEDQLYKQTEILQSVLNSMGEGVIVADQEGRVLLINPAAAQTLGHPTTFISPEASLEQWGFFLADKVTPYPLAEFPLIQAIQGHTIDNIEMFVQHEHRPEGLFINMTARPLRDAGGVLRGSVAVFHDITERKRREQEREHAQQQERLAAVGQLAAGIAHDFNNILTTIIGFAELIRYEPEAVESPGKALGHIIEQGQRAAQLIRQILDFSRQSVTSKEPVDLMALVQEVLQLFERTIPENIQLHLDIQPSPEAYVLEADPTQIQQVLTNLAVNAWHAMPNGGQLLLRLSQLALSEAEAPPCAGMPPGRWLVLSVSDTGVGIPPEVLPHIFEPFFTTKMVGQGTGLGLAQAYGLIKQHGGEIGVSSQVGQGTTFTVYLPAFSTTAPKPPEVITQRLPQGHGELILLVEDDPLVLAVYQMTLKQLGYGVVTAQNGQQALAIYREQGLDIDLVLTDITLPGMSGASLVQTLRQQNPEIKVVAMTGYPMEPKAREGLLQDFATWMQKPVGIEQLAQIINRVLQQS